MELLPFWMDLDGHRILVHSVDQYHKLKIMGYAAPDWVEGWVDEWIRNHN